MRLRIIKTLLVLLSISFLTLSCTQHQSSSASLKFQMPSQKKVNSSSCSNCIISFAVVNIHEEGGSSPKVFTKDFKDSDNASKSDLVLEVSDLKVGTSIIIQFLVVLKNQTTGSRSFAYGDQLLTLQAGDNQANILSHFIGGSSKTGLVGGRLLDTISTGPTGTMIGSLKPPPGSISPYPLQIFKSDIFNGWFNIIVVEGTDALFTYTLEETGEELFTDVNIQSFAAMTTQSFQLKASTTPYYSMRDSGVKAAKDIFMGFYPRNTNLLPTLGAAGYEACYFNGAEAVPSLYEDALKTDSLEFSGDASSRNFNVDTSTGVQKTFPQLFNAAVSGCDAGSGAALRLNHQLLDEGDGDLFGFKGPFQIIDPFNGNNGYVTSVIPAPGSINLTWKYLPGISNVEVEGVTLFQKTGGSGNSSDDEDFDCRERAIEESFSAVIDVLQAQNTFQVTGITSGDENNYRFKICPYKTVGGERKYFKEGIESHCRGNCTQATSMGHGIASKTGVTGSFNTPTSPSSTEIGGGYSQATDIDATTSQDYTIVTASFPSGHWVDGDEALFSVVAEGNNACGDTVEPGDFFFTRLFNRDVGAYKIPKGSFFDVLATDGSINAILSASGTATNASHSFCRIQITKVPNYKSLEINGAITSNNISLNGTGAVGNNGGLITARVNGLFHQNTDLGLNGVGHEGASAKRGAGHLGGTDSLVTTGTGGAAGAGGGSGGAGYGNSGSPGTFPAGFGLSKDQHGFRMIAGGAGGGSITVPSLGGRGGGSIFITANHYQVTGSRLLSVDGTPSAGAGGGGAGGSINIMANKLIGTGDLTLAADGANSSAGSGAGGGWVKASFCENSSSVLGGVSASGGTGAAPAVNGEAGMTSTEEPHFCPE